MGKGFASPAQYRGDDFKPALVSNWRALTTHLNSYVPTFNADGVTLALPGDLDVAGALTTGTAIDHGGLSGKADDDHTQYYNAARHTKAIHDVLALDHGSLAGKGDDDHTIYSKADGTRAFTGVVSGVTPTADAHLATKGYVNDEVQVTTVYHGNTQSIASSATPTTLSWNQEETDHGDWHSTVTANGRITVATAGIYLIHASVNWNSSSGAGYRNVILLQNGANVAYNYRGAWALASSNIMSVNRVVVATANTYFQVQVRQTSGGNIVIPAGAPGTSGTYFQVTRLGSL